MIFGASRLIDADDDTSLENRDRQALGEVNNYDQSYQFTNLKKYIDFFKKNGYNEAKILTPKKPKVLINY